jgi:hypothetical protein
MEISQDTLTRWADSCLHMNHLGTLVQRELQQGDHTRAQDLAERARHRAWVLLNELFDAGAVKPEGYAEPGAGPNNSFKPKPLRGSA